MKKEYNYFYKITNLINNRYYFGVHKTSNLDDNYFGSGKRLKYAIIKYGVENFKKEIIKYFDKYESALRYEAEIVTEDLVNDIECYNLKIGGSGGNCWIFENKKGKITVKDKKTNKYIKVLTDSEYYMNKENYDHIFKNKVSVIDNSGITYSVDSNDERYINGELNGVSKNKIMVKDNKNNYYQVDINDERYISGELTAIWKNRKHNTYTIDKMKLTHQLNGDQKGEKNSQFGTCWITNNVENKKIKKEELINYLTDNWIKGRKIK